MLGEVVNSTTGQNFTFLGSRSCLVRVLAKLDDDKYDKKNRAHHIVSNCVEVVVFLAQLPRAYYSSNNNIIVAATLGLIDSAVTLVSLLM